MCNSKYLKIVLAMLFLGSLHMGSLISSAYAASDADTGDSEPVDDSPTRSRTTDVTGNSKIEIAPVKEGHAVMYIYRPKKFLGSFRKAFFTLKGVDVAKVKNGRYTWIYVPQGRQTFKVGWMREARWSSRSSGLTMNFIPGETYYYWFDNSDSYSSGRYYHYRYRVRRMSRYSAVAAMERLIYQRTVKTKKKKKKRKSEE